MPSEKERTAVTEAVGNGHVDARAILNVLAAVKRGDFSVRLPNDWTGIGGKIADTFNEVLDRNEKLAKELDRVSRVVGKEGKLSGQAVVPGVGIYGVDTQGRCIFINRAAAAMLGYRPDELMTRQMHEVIHRSRHDGSPYPVEECGIKKIFESGQESRTADEVFGRRDGTAFLVEYAAHPIIDRGTIQGAVVSFVDISQRKQAEAAFREQSRLLEIFFRYTQTAIVFLDRNFNFIRVNESYARACQRPASEFPGHNHFELYPSDAQKIFEEVRATKVLYHAVAHPFVFPDHPEWGVTYWDWTLIPVLDASGEVEIFVFSLNDVTERKHAETALRESQERFQLAVQGINDGLWDWRIDTNDVYLSPRWKNILGYHDEEIPNHYDEWERRVHPDDHDAVIAAQKAYLDGRTPIFYAEYRLQHKNGTYRWVLSRGVALRDATGKPYRMVGSHTDCTDRKEAEEALRERKQQLRDALEERERLCQNLHDNIIQTVYAVGMSLDASRDLVTANPEGVASRLRQAVDDLNRVIRDVRRDIAGKGHAILNGKAFSSELAGLIRTMGGGLFHGFRLRLDDGAVALLTSEEATHLLAIAREAMSNSLRHSGAKSVTLSLRAQNGRLRFEVKDDGRGFEVQERSEGWGQGLRNIAVRAKRLDAQLHLRSGPGQGTRLTIVLRKAHVSDVSQNG